MNQLIKIGDDYFEKYYRSIHIYMNKNECREHCQVGNKLLNCDDWTRERVTLHLNAIMQKCEKYIRV